MTDEAPGTQKPYFAIEQDTPPDTVHTLRELEADIFRDPVAVMHVAIAIGKEALEGNQYVEKVAIATSRQAGLEFDADSEAAIRQSETMKSLQEQRRAESSQDRAIALAAEVRRHRLELFIGRVIDYETNHPEPEEALAETQPASVISLQEGRRRVTRKKKDISA